MNTIAIVDYGLCNLDSVRRAVEECGGHPKVTDRPEEVASADRVILPGVGAFPEAMANLQRNGMVDALERRVVGDGCPFLGICLGMQLMATKSCELRSTRGLAWIAGEVRRLEPQPGMRVPHVGWNEVHFSVTEPLFAGVLPGADFYFVHSYVVWPNDVGQVVGRTPYGLTQLVSTVRKDNMVGVQFHPEKSQRLGFQVLRNFLSL